MDKKTPQKVDITLKITAALEVSDEELEVEDPDTEKAEAAIAANIEQDDS